LIKKGVLVILVILLLSSFASAATVSHKAEDIVPGNFGANHDLNGNYTFDGNVLVDGDLNVSTGNLYFPDGSVMTTASSGSGSSLWTNSSGNATFNSGNVGIGALQLF